MGLHRLPAIAESLIRAGKPPTTPAAIISRGSTPLQKTVTASLSELPVKAKQAELHAPSIIIVGSASRSGTRLPGSKPGRCSDCGWASHAWQDRRGPRSRACCNWGRAPGPAADDHRGPSPTGPKWMLSSAASASSTGLSSPASTACRGLLDRLWFHGGDARAFAGRGQTGGDRCRGRPAVLKEYGLRADLVPQQFRAEALAGAALRRVPGSGPVGPGQPWSRRSAQRPPPRRQNSSKSWSSTRTGTPSNFHRKAGAALERGEADWIGLSSPSIARNLARLLPEAACGPARPYLAHSQHQPRDHRRGKRMRACQFTRKRKRIPGTASSRPSCVP